MLLCAESADPGLELEEFSRDKPASAKLVSWGQAGCHPKSKCEPSQNFKAKKRENEWELLISSLSMEFAVDDSPLKELLEAFRISKDKGKICT